MYCPGVSQKRDTVGILTGAVGSVTVFEFGHGINRL